MGRRLAQEEHPAALALASRNSAIVMFGAGLDDDPLAKVKGLITTLINRLQTEASSEARHKSSGDEETARATKKEDLESDVAKHSSKIEAGVARGTVLDGELAALQSELGSVSARQLDMDNIRVDERTTFAKAKEDLEQGTW